MRACVCARACACACCCCCCVCARARMRVCTPIVISGGYYRRTHRADRVLAWNGPPWSHPAASPRALTSGLLLHKHRSTVRCPSPSFPRPGLARACALLRHEFCAPFCLSSRLTLSGRQQALPPTVRWEMRRRPCYATVLARAARPVASRPSAKLFREQTMLSHRPPAPCRRCLPCTTLRSTTQQTTSRPRKPRRLPSSARARRASGCTLSVRRLRRLHPRSLVRAALCRTLRIKIGRECCERQKHTCKRRFQAELTCLSLRRRDAFGRYVSCCAFETQRASAS